MHKPFSAQVLNCFTLFLVLVPREMSVPVYLQGSRGGAVSTMFFWDKSPPPVLLITAHFVLFQYSNFSALELYGGYPE